MVDFKKTPNEDVLYNEGRKLSIYTIVIRKIKVSLLKKFWFSIFLNIPRLDLSTIRTLYPI